jgi:ankyrin repeat protein
MKNILITLTLLGALNLLSVSAASSTEQAAGDAYLKYNKAIHDGDLGAVKPYLAEKATLAEFEDKQNFELIRDMSPKEVKIVTTVISDNKVTLTLEGLLMGEKAIGTVGMVLIEQQWKVASEHWKIRIEVTPLENQKLSNNNQVKEQPSEKSQSGEALFQAIAMNDINAIQTALDQGVSLQIEDSNGKHPIHTATSLGRMPIIKLFLEKGVEVDAKSKSGQTPLMTAAFHKKLEAAKFLLEKNAAIDVTDNDGSTPLMYAASGGDANIITLLIEHGAKVDEAIGKEYSGFAGKTPLMEAAWRNRVEAAKVLIDKGATIDTKDAMGSNALLQAVFHGNLEMVKLLVEKGADLKVKDAGGKTALAIAMERSAEAPEMVNLLKEAGAKE